LQSSWRVFQLAAGTLLEASCQCIEESSMNLLRFTTPDHYQVLHDSDHDDDEKEDPREVQALMKKTTTS
jgi:hypothetical protein